MVGLEVKPTLNKGLGVFSTRYFEKGDLIECIRVLVVPTNEIFISGALSVMRHYVFEWPNNKLAVPTGFGCFYNHSYQPNAIHIKHIDLKEIHIHALQHIPRQEEITINYGGVPDYNEPLWFTVKEI